MIVLRDFQYTVDGVRWQAMVPWWPERMHQGKEVLNFREIMHRYDPQTNKLVDVVKAADHHQQVARGRVQPVKWNLGDVYSVT